MKNLTYIANKIHLTDKGSVFGSSHGFTDFYNDVFEEIYNICKYENRKVNVLEIGVLNGYSLLMLNDFFGNNCNIIGLDIDDFMINKFNTTYGTYNMQVLKCDQSNINDLENFMNEYSDIKFDIIIDDGSHVYSHQMLSLFMLSKMLTDNGIYVLEDLHTSLGVVNTDFGDNSNKPTTPLYSLMFRVDSPHLTKEQNDDLFNRLCDVVVYNRKNYNCPTFNNASVTSIITFKNN